MFNFLANFEESDLKNTLREVHQVMTEKDVLIPSFFQYEPCFDTIHHDGRFSNVQCTNKLSAVGNRPDIPYTEELISFEQMSQEFTKKSLFEQMTLRLYDNPETENWVSQSFIERYRPNCAPKFHVDYNKNNKASPPFMEVSLQFPKNVKLIINGEKTAGNQLLQSTGDNVKFTAFRSYRVSKSYLTKLLEEI
jgi:hypothetical protein